MVSLVSIGPYRHAMLGSRVTDPEVIQPVAMNQEQFDRLVGRLERQAASNPSGYRLRLAAFASLGYLYVFGILAALAGLIALTVYGASVKSSFLVLAKKIIIPLALLIIVVLRAMWVRLEAPEGLRLERSEYPTLFDTIDGIRRAARAPRVHETLLTSELNAAIVQIPRLGLLGWQKNYLILGLPLMQMLSPDEFKAVLAHEFGHLSGAHGRFGAWIYRLRAAWARLNERLQHEQSWGRFLFVPFFGWFAPKFAAWSFVQARQQEYEADKLAAETVGADSITSALARLDIKAEDLERVYWPGVYEQADHIPQPTPSPYRALLQAEARGFLPQAPDQLRQALQRETSTADTHPCLRDRVGALNIEAGMPPPIRSSAAEALFGDGLASLTDHFDDEWRASVADWWHGRHQYVRDSRERLNAFSSQDPAGLGDENLFEFARLTEEFVGPDAALDLYRTLVVRSPEHPGACFGYGRLLLERDDDHGVELIERVMAQAPGALIPGCELIVGFLRRQGRGDEIQPYLDRYWERQAVEEAILEERSGLTLNDRFLPAEMPAASLDRLRGALDRTGKVRRAYLVRKSLLYSETPLYIVGIEPKGAVFKLNARKSAEALRDELAETVGLDEDLFFVALHSETRLFRNRLREVEDSCIYPA